MRGGTRWTRALDVSANALIDDTWTHALLETATNDVKDSTSKEDCTVQNAKLPTCE